MSKTMTHEEIISDLKKRFENEPDYIMHGLRNDYIVVHDTGWEDDDKYQYQYIVVTPVNANIRNLVRIMLTRQGSYYTEYNYLDNHYEAVEAYEVLTTHYRPIK